MRRGGKAEDEAQKRVDLILRKRFSFPVSFSRQSRAKTMSQHVVTPAAFRPIIHAFRYQRSTCTSIPLLVIGSAGKENHIVLPKVELHVPFTMTLAD